MIEMIEPTVPATTEQPAPQPTQGVFMENFQAPNLVGIIMQALEQHIEAMVDKRFNERMADFEMPSMDDVKNALTDMLDEKMKEHTHAYDHEDYDRVVSLVDDSDLDDLEEKVRDILRSTPITLDL
jgi:hypothetical protein